MKQVERLLGHRINNIIYIFFLLLIPVFWLRGYGHFFARVPQMFLWLSAVFIFFALLQRNIWIKLLLLWFLFLTIYYDFIVGFKVEGILYKTLNQESLLVLFTAIGIIVSINFVQKLNEKYIKIFIYFSSLIVFYVWFFGYFKGWENLWIGGAYLAFCIPVALSLHKKFYINIFLCLPLLYGVYLSNSSMAVLTALGGIISYLLLTKRYKLNGLFLLILLIVAGYWIPKHKDFLNMSFRDRMWELSLQKVGYKNWVGTGLKSFKRYGFIEGRDGKGVTYVSHPHNEFLEVYCEWGWVGLCLLLFYLGELVYMSNAPKEYVAGLMAVGVHCMGYYAARLACTGTLIIFYIGMLEKYRRGKEC